MSDLFGNHIVGFTSGRQCKMDHNAIFLWTPHDIVADVSLVVIENS